MGSQQQELSQCTSTKTAIIYITTFYFDLLLIPQSRLYKFKTVKCNWNIMNENVEF